MEVDGLSEGGWQRQYWMQGGGDEAGYISAPDARGFAVWFVTVYHWTCAQKKSFFYIAVVRSSDYRPIVY